LQELWRNANQNRSMLCLLELSVTLPLPPG
jgi:hypothetical protein